MRSSCSQMSSSMLTGCRFTTFAGVRNVALKSAKSDLRYCLLMRCCFGGSVVAVMAVALVAVCSLPNRFSSATALAVVVLLIVLSLLTAELGLVKLSDLIIKSGLRVVDTWVSGASVNLVDLDAEVKGVFVVFIVCFFELLNFG